MCSNWRRKTNCLANPLGREEDLKMALHGTITISNNAIHDVLPDSPKGGPPWFRVWNPQWQSENVTSEFTESNGRPTPPAQVPPKVKDSTSACPHSALDQTGMDSRQTRPCHTTQRLKSILNNLLAKWGVWKIFGGTDDNYMNPSSSFHFGTNFVLNSICFHFIFKIKKRGRRFPNPLICLCNNICFLSFILSFQKIIAPREVVFPIRPQEER